MSSPSARHFDDLAPRYAELRASPHYVDPLTEQVAEFANLRGKRVLDVGCGPGNVVLALADEYDVAAVGVDASPRMVEVARRAVGERAEVVVGETEALPFPDASFDAVLVRLAVHHFDRPRAFIELRRVVRPGGTAVITTTDPAAFASFWMVPFFPSYVAVEQSRFPTADALERELHAAGFGHVRHVPIALQRSFSRREALAKLRGRAYSTFALIGEDEYQAGLAAAEATLPDEIEYELRLFHVVATAP